MNTRLLIMGAVFVGLMLMVTNKKEPRGIRNNNPLNIRKGSDNWNGSIGDDGAFVVFDSPLMGIRAATKLLVTYRDKYNITNIFDILQRFAPPTENNTTSYIDHVAAAVGVGRYESLLESDFAALLAAMIKHENGVQPYSNELIEQGVQMGLET